MSWLRRQDLTCDIRAMSLTACGIPGFLKLQTQWRLVAIATHAFVACYAHCYVQRAVRSGPSLLSGLYL